MKCKLQNTILRQKSLICSIILTIEKKKKKTFLILHDVITLLTTLLIPEIKMATHRLQGQGRVAKKNIKIKGTRNYYFKTIGYCSTTKFNLELSKTYEVL